MAGNDSLIPREQTEVSLTPEEQLTKQFYAWERRGRGWQVWNFPVELEPPFRPFFGYYLPPPPVRDDGRKPTFLSSLVEGLFSRRNNQSQEATESSETIAAILENFEEPEPDLFFDTSPITEIQIALPADSHITSTQAEQFLLSLKYSVTPISFEVIGLSNSIVVQLACRESELTLLQNQLRAYFPDATLYEESDFLVTEWAKTSGTSLVVDFGLSHEFIIPLQTISNFTVDPLIGICGALADLRNGEVGLIQVLFQPTIYPWVKSAEYATLDFDGKSVFPNAPELAHFLKEKTKYPLYAALIRIAAKSWSSERVWQIAKRLGGSLATLNSATGNELIPLSNDAYDDFIHEECVLERQTLRSGMILNSSELVSLVHPPSSSVRSEKLKRDQRKTKSAPSIALDNKPSRIVLGENNHQGKQQLVSLNEDQRTKHIYVIGASGTGKSTLLLNLIRQDIEQGNGVCVLDPHGDLINAILGYIPETRNDDVILLDPADEEYPIPFNILSAHSELEKTLLSSDLVSVFRRLSTSWGDQMTSVLANAILAFLESSKGGTLHDLKRFLVELQFRKEFLTTVEDETVVYYWEKEFPLITGSANKPQAPLLTRLDTFLRPKLIRNMVTQRENRLDFRLIMDERKILLAKLSQGAIGRENAYLLGTLIVAKLNQTALGRQDVSQANRPFFSVVIDEFQDFITPSMASILSGARKYHLGLTLAHQDFRQLWNQDTEVASAVLTNPYTRVCFRLGDADAQKLSEGFSSFTPADLQNLSVGESIARIERNEYDFNLKTFPLPQIDETLAEERRQHIKERSRAQFAVKREGIEAVKTETETGTKTEAETNAETNAEVNEKAIEERIAKVNEEESLSKDVHSQETLSGKGGQQHKYLQHLVKRIAENNGYRVTIEQHVFGGTGKVDVSLERDDVKIACEISVTTPGEYELGNIQKCLAAGYKPVIVISANEKHLNNIRQRAQAALLADDFTNIVFLQPDSFYAYLESLPPHSEESADRVKGFKVNVAYNEANETETRLRSKALAEIISNAKKRRNG